MVIVFYISGHGFGHASRDLELIRALMARRPDARIIVRTAITARWFADLAAEHGAELQPVEVDTGLVQIGSLRIDEDETAREAARFYAGFDSHVDREAAVIRSLGADLVIGDIPPLAFAAAARAGVPSVALSNFTWDWIYSIYPAFDRLAPDVLPAIRRAYAAATHALRLPLYGGFEPMAAVTEDVPFIARQSARDPRATRRALGLADDRPVVLPYFGAYGVNLPLDRVARLGRFELIDPERSLPGGFFYEDLVAAADVVVTKPGYGIVSECVANGAALLYTSRGRFAEYDVFVEEMPNVLRCRYISQEDLLAGRWAEAIEALLAQPAPPHQPRIDGADVAADKIMNLVIG
jgi:UDP:flavonoid glycosyltransferase YjiC (YdhE family)